jgi:endonuclease G
MFKRCRLTSHILFATLLGVLPALSAQAVPGNVSIDSIDQLGVPQGYDQRLNFSSFSIGYNYSKKHADWVGTALLPELVRIPRDRVNSFRAEAQIPAQYRATLDDYAHSGYDRGHLAPNATHDQTKQSMYDTYTLANMSPQTPKFNRGSWAQLERYVRDCAASYEDGEPLFVFTGPYYGSTSNTVGASKIPVPEGYYKVIYEFNGDTASAMAVQAPQASFDFDRLASFVVSVDTIEDLTGLDFATALADDIETSLEASPEPACPIPAKETADEVAGFGSCGSKKTCSKMSSCAEAKYFLNVCGVSRLDANKDGIPCEAICK